MWYFYTIYCRDITKIGELGEELSERYEEFVIKKGDEA